MNLLIQIGNLASYLIKKGGDHLIREYPDLNIKRMPTMDTVVETCVLGRNMLRDQAFQGGFDYLMFIEQDIIPHTDIVEKLMQHQKSVCSALYFNEMQPSTVRHGVDTLYFPMVWSFNSPDPGTGYSERLIRSEDLFKGELMQVDVCGLAAVLIGRKVLEKIRFRYINGSPPLFEEFCFGRDCKEKRVDIYLDPSLVCRHYSARGL